MRRGTFLLGLAVTACGSSPTTSPSPSPTPPPRAAIAVSLEIQPLIASPDPTRRFLARWTVVVQETNGVGGTLNFVNSSLRDAQSGASARPTGNIALGLTDIVALAGTSRIDGRGALRVPASLEYFLVSGGRAVRLNVAVQFQDDSGNVLSETAEALFQ